MRRRRYPIAVPNYLSIVQACKDEFPTEWANAHTGNAQTDDFIKIVAARIHAIDPRIGNNGKRGDANDISDDALCYFGEGPDHVSGYNNTQVPASVIDVIGSAGTPAAVPTWNNVSNPNAPIRTAFVEPGASAAPAPTPTPGIPSYEDLGGDASGVKISQAMERDYKRAERPGLDGGCGAWMQRTVYDYIAGIVPTPETSIEKHRQEWCDELGIPVE